MSDLAAQRGYRLDRAALERALGVPVVPTVAVRSVASARSWMPSTLTVSPLETAARAHQRLEPQPAASGADIEATQREVRRVLHDSGYRVPARLAVLSRLDAVVLNPIAGPALLDRAVPHVPGGVQLGQSAAEHHQQRRPGHEQPGLSGVLPPGPLRSLLLDAWSPAPAVLLVFLPQILILFLFILALEDSGYLPRAAFMLDRLMGRVGLSAARSFRCCRASRAPFRHHGGAHHPLRARPPRDHMIAPLMTCSARLPVYALLIGAFIPQRTIGILTCGDLVLFALYLAAS